MFSYYYASANFQNSMVRTLIPALISLHWLRVPERIYFKLAVMMYPSIHGTSPSYLQPCFTRVPDTTSRRWLRSFTSHRLDVPPVRLSTVGRRAFPVSGASPVSTSHLRRHSQFSYNDSRPFCFPVPTKTLSYDSYVTITIHHYCLDTCGPCSN